MKTINNDLDEEKRFYDFLKVSFWIISDEIWNMFLSWYISNGQKASCLN